MSDLVHISELASGREFLIPCAELPEKFAHAIISAKPISTLARPMRAEDPECFAMLDSETCRIVDIAELVDSQAVALADVVSLCPNGGRARVCHTHKYIHCRSTRAYMETYQLPAILYQRDTSL